MFKSNLTQSNVMYKALDAFNLEHETDVKVTSHSWGVMVEVLSGSHKVHYDFHADINSFIAA